mgnify:CR=1 FL=1
MANATNANILSALRQELSFEVQNHLPEEVSDNLQGVYDSILNYAPIRNEIVPSMINRIGMQTGTVLHGEIRWHDLKKSL